MVHAFHYLVDGDPSHDGITKRPIPVMHWCIQFHLDDAVIESIGTDLRRIGRPVETDASTTKTERAF